ncbi:MAG: type VII toxin-antitoxin system HepT family RNase toxin [Egibacteraceae bacterium]
MLIHELDRLDAVKYRFGTAIEGLIDAAHHLISSERLRAPSTYAEAFVVLGEAGFLDHELAGTAQEIARFRNLLVHGYAEVDDERVIGLLATRLGDLDALRTALARTGSR